MTTLDDSIMQPIVYRHGYGQYQLGNVPKVFCDHAYNPRHLPTVRGTNPRDLIMDVGMAHKFTSLLAWGFICGPRDPRLNTNYPGAFMVAEHYEESELPTPTSSNGPWCIVGDDIDALIDEAFAMWVDEYTTWWE
jgi:hypothetical protein